MQLTVSTITNLILLHIAIFINRKHFHWENSCYLPLMHMYFTFWQQLTEVTFFLSKHQTGFTFTRSQVSCSGQLRLHFSFLWCSPKAMPLVSSEPSVTTPHHLQFTGWKTGSFSPPLNIILIHNSSKDCKQEFYSDVKYAKRHFSFTTRWPEAEFSFHLHVTLFRGIRKWLPDCF